MKKKRLLKTLSFSSLAVLMAAAGTFAFAPLGASPSTLANENQTEMTTSGGLGLDPKNDPVVYTTESGLEIRMSNATKYSGTTSTVTNLGTAYTQDLTSFYYFTMGTYSGTIYTAKTRTDAYTVSSEPVNWIILGLGPNTGYFLDEVSANLFSTWKTNTSGIQANKTIAGTYFFNSIFENTTPAGSAINTVVPSKSYVMEKVKASIPIDPADEIPEGCMLVISEKLLGQYYFNGSGALNYQLYTPYTSYCPCYLINSTNSYGNRYRYFGNSSSVAGGDQSWTTSGYSGGSLYNAYNNLFSKNTSGTILKNSLGFTQAQADLIVPQQLYTYFSNGTGYNYQETPSSDGGTYYTMFPLAYRAAYSSIYQNFCIEDYLSTSAKKIGVLIGSSTNLSFSWWLRSGHNASVNSYTQVVDPDGNIRQHYSTYTNGMRPAMVMKLQ